MEKREIKIMTRIMSQPNGSSILKLTVKNGWSFWNRFTVKDSKDLRDYLKSDEFKEYAYNVFSKYEGMTYKDMCELWKTDNKADFQKIWDKLDGFAWRTDEEPFRINVSVKLTRTYSNGFTYRVEFSNNKDGKRSWIRKFEEGHFIGKDYANEILGDYRLWLDKDKELSDKLSSYKNWDDFHNDFFNTRDINNLVDFCLAA